MRRNEEDAVNSQSSEEKKLQNPLDLSNLILIKNPNNEIAIGNLR